MTRPADKPKGKQTRRWVRGRLRNVLVSKDDKGKERVKVLEKPVPFEDEFNSQVAKNRDQVMKKSITENISKALFNMVELDREWGGGLDFEVGMKDVERIAALHGRPYLWKNGALTAAVETDEKRDFELGYHTHPLRNVSKRYHEVPSNGDLANTTFTNPEIIITKDRNFRKKAILVRSLHKRGYPSEHFDKAWDGAADDAAKEVRVNEGEIKAAKAELHMEAMALKDNPKADSKKWERAKKKVAKLDKKDERLREQYNTGDLFAKHYRKRLNAIGFDFRKIDFKKEKIVLNKDKALEGIRVIQITRRRARPKVIEEGKWQQQHSKAREKGLKLNEKAMKRKEFKEKYGH